MLQKINEIGSWIFLLSVIGLGVYSCVAPEPEIIQDNMTEQELVEHLENH